MKSTILACICAVTLLSTLAIPVRLAAHDDEAAGRPYTVLYAFTGGADGAEPLAGLVQDKEGNLYGTTYKDGDFSGVICTFLAGCGVVFKLDPVGNETLLYTFTGGTDGASPVGGLILDDVGNLYGTTYFGGAEPCPESQYGCGVVFKLDPAGNERVLCTFTGGADGALPRGNLVRDKLGNLYGATERGGISPYFGVIFKVDLTGNESVVYTFTGGADGSSPNGDLILDEADNLYGTTFYGCTSLRSV